MTPQRKRLENKTRMLERRCKVIDLHRQGYTQTEIAKMLKTTQATISGDLKTLLQEWRVQSNDAFEQYLDREMDNLIHVEQTAWKHFEKSCIENIETTDTEGKNIRRIRTGSGDPRFLETILRCIGARCKLLGLDQKHVIDVNLNAKTTMEKAQDLANASVSAMARLIEKRNDIDVPKDIN